MRALLDACILYPTVLREILIGVAATGAYTPLVGPRILDEWIHTAARSGAEATAVAKAEVALLRARFPNAEVFPPANAEVDLSLPDPNDLHVLAAAITGQADVIMTENLRDFPGRTLARYGLVARSPDSVLVELLTSGVDVAGVVAQVQAATEQASGREQPLRPLLKRAGLRRLGKALG